MSKKDLISKIAAEIGVAKGHVEAVLDRLATVVREAVEAGEELVIPGIGKISTKERAARTGRNPATGEAVEIPAKTVVKIAPAKPLKDAAESS